jgi:uncharacterized coiled-coil protein SlyX
MSNLRPESRIKSLEKRATDIEAAIEELSSDQAEELKAIRQDIKKLDDGITDSYKSIGDTFVALGEDLDTVIATMATKDDLNQLRQEMKTDMAELKSMMTQLLQQKSGE